MLDLTDVLGWGYLDIKFLDSKISEFELETEDIKDEIDSIGFESADINSWIYCTIYLGARRFLESVETYAQENDIEFCIDDIEIEVYTNYLDSFVNGDKLNSDIDISDYSEENLQHYLDWLKDK